MIRPALDLAEIFICIAPVDFRMQINGLSALVQDELELDPFSEKLFAFTNRRRDRVRILVWERSGFVLWMNVWSASAFIGHAPMQGTVTLSGQELNWLLDGFDLSRWRPHQRPDYQWVA